jgi:hypothetical protein
LTGINKARLAGFVVIETNLVDTMSGDDQCPRRELRRPGSGVGSQHRNILNPCTSDGSRSSSLDQGFQTVEDIEEGIRLLPVDDESSSLEIAKEVALSIHSFCADNANILK